MDGGDPRRPRVTVATFGPVSRPTGGLTWRARTVVEALGQLGASVTVISTEESPRAGPGELGSCARLVVMRQVGRFRLLVELARAIRHAGRCDAIVVESALLIPGVVLARSRTPVIWDTNELETLHYRRLPRTVPNMAKGLVWRGLERWAVRRATAVVAVSDVEASWWLRLFPQSQGKLFTVDLEAPRRPEVGAGATAFPAESSRPRLLFMGNLAAKHNRAAARWLGEILAPQLPTDVEVTLVGPGTERLSFPLGGAVIRCTGALDDVAPWIKAAALCLAPLASGAGIKTKVLDYVSQGKVVVGTPVAFEGLDGCPGLVATSLEEFGSVVMRTLDALAHETVDQAHRRRAAQREWLSAHHTRSRSVEQWSRVLQSVGILVIGEARDGNGVSR